MMKKCRKVWKGAALGMVLLGCHTMGRAVDSFTVEGGAGEDVQIVRAGVQWDWEKRWFRSNGKHIGGYWDLSVARWRGTHYKNDDGRHQYITSIGITPVFRWQRDDKKGFYVEGGVGINQLSEHYNNNEKQLSSKFQFGDHIGVGYVFDNKIDFGVKYLHYSNAGIKEPNDGADFVLARMRYFF